MRFRLACQPCIDYLLPVNGFTTSSSFKTCFLFAYYWFSYYIMLQSCKQLLLFLRIVFYFDWQVFLIHIIRSFYFSPVNLYWTTRLSRGFRYTIIGEDVFRRPRLFFEKMKRSVVIFGHFRFHLARNPRPFFALAVTFNIGYGVWDKLPTPS